MKKNSTSSLKASPRGLGSPGSGAHVLCMRNYFLSVSTGTKRRKRDSGRESECGGLWELMDGLAGAWRDQGCCPLPQAHPSGLGELGWGSRLRACSAWGGGSLSRPLCSAPRHLLTPRGHWEPSQVPAGLQFTPHRKRKCGSLAFSSRETQGRMEWGSQDSRDPPDPQGLSSTCRSRM